MTSCVCAGEAKVHECLRTNLNKISDACRKEEISLSVLQASNTELMPNIAIACKVRAPHISLHATRLLYRSFPMDANSSSRPNFSCCWSKTLADESHVRCKSCGLTPSTCSRKDVGVLDHAQVAEVALHAQYMAPFGDDAAG